MSAEDAREKGRVALRELDGMLGKDDGAITHPEITQAVRCIVAYRNGLIDAHRAGECTRDELDRVNSLLSLAHGAEYPLIGFHRDRLEKAREEIRDMLGE